MLDHPILFAVDDLEALSYLTDELIEGSSIEELLEALGRIQDGLATLQTVFSLIDAAIIAARGKTRDPLPVPGGGTYKVSGGRTKQVYDNERLIGAIGKRMVEHVKAAAVVTPDGERVDAAPIIAEVVKRTAACAAADTASFDGWRKGDTEGLGLKLSDYRETTVSDLRGRIEARR